MEKTWMHLQDFEKKTRASGYLEDHRKKQSAYWLKSSIDEKLQHLFYQNTTIQQMLPKLQRMVLDGQLTSFAAADQLLELFSKSQKGA